MIAVTNDAGGKCHKIDEHLQRESQNYTVCRRLYAHNQFQNHFGKRRKTHNCHLLVVSGVSGVSVAHIANNDRNFWLVLGRSCSVKYIQWTGCFAFWHILLKKHVKICSMRGYVAMWINTTNWMLFFFAFSFPKDASRQERAKRKFVESMMMQDARERGPSTSVWAMIYIDTTCDWYFFFSVFGCCCFLHFIIIGWTLDTDIVEEIISWKISFQQNEDEQRTERKG